MKSDGNFLGTLFKPVLVAMLVFFSTSANALLIQISDTADFSTNVVSADDTNDDGVVTLFSSLGTWTTNFSAGFSAPLIDDQLDLLSGNISGEAGTIYVRLTDTDFDKSPASWWAGFGGTTMGTVSFQSYADASNTAFGQGILLTDSGDIATRTFSGTDSGGLDMSAPYSLSIYAAITHNDSFSITSFGYEVTTVPEPGTLALLGIGLLGMGLVARKKRA
ncbi:MAG: PEP-CTERM sorting domain-containing protein [Gammaproteobacteria bacterium]|jgi:hypothetical protein|nr:PEP-CTERM sorting domain-containing protein [Gammaproteobacteria bacterium]